MLYVFPITTPANTPASAKLKTILPLSAGTITRIMLQFPFGPQGLAHIALNRGLHQLAPANPGSDFATEFETIIWVEDYRLFVEPYQLEAYSWNLATDFAHTITVRVELVPRTIQPNLAQEIALLLSQQEAA